MSNPLRDLTSREAVLEAIRLCDETGREEFLNHYGYKAAKTYFLRHNNHEYDSKAIVGVAYGIQHGVTLKSADFSGGENTVARCLRRLGFSVTEPEHPALRLERGAEYFRVDLRATYGGQLQSGIWTPRDFATIFLFTGASGKTYGYHDDWNDGVFEYTGEGQNGDMTFTGGNKAIRDHRKDGKDLLLFTDLGKGKGVRYEGLFECASWTTVRRPGKDKTSRAAIVFSLIPVSTEAHTNEKAPIAPTENDAEHAPAISNLKAAAYEAAGEPPRTTPIEARQSWFKRSEAVKRYVLARAGGKCEACEAPAPFKKKRGEPYLEPHHTQRLADDGPDHPRWVGAICPNCHRRIHSGEDGKEWNFRLQERLKILEPES